MYENHPKEVCRLARYALGALVLGVRLRMLPYGGEGAAVVPAPTLLCCFFFLMFWFLLSREERAEGICALFFRFLRPVLSRYR